MLQKLYCISFLLMTFSFAKAQQNANSLQGVKRQIYLLNKKFDSAYFMQFDVNYTYSALDTITGKNETSEKNATYVLKKDNFYYTMDNDIEFMQNDSLNFTVFQKNKMIMMSRKGTGFPSANLPLKAITDSALSGYSKYYNISIVPSTVDTNIHIILFQTNGVSNDLLYKSIEVKYRKKTKELSEIVMHYDQLDNVAVEDTVTNRIVNKPIFYKKTMDISFSGYKPSTIDPKIFSTDRYIYFNGARRKYALINKFRGYRFFIDGIEQN